MKEAKCDWIQLQMHLTDLFFFIKFREICHYVGFVGIHFALALYSIA
jgi:hypothetical protein